MKAFFEIKNLFASVEDKQILQGLNLKINQGEVHAIMGPNGSGKSTMANIIMGNEEYSISKGKISFLGENITELTPDERAKRGMFLAFQYPKEIAGLNTEIFLRASYLAVKKALDKNFETPSVFKFRKLLNEKMEFLKINEKFLDRFLNKGFSGGEKKKMEMLQMLLLEPKFAVLDETDSGLDIDALKIVAKTVNHLRKSGMTVLVITHYQRILNHLNPDFVHVMANGKIIKSGGHEFADILEKEGYENLLKLNK